MIGFWKKGEPYVWVSGAALATILIITLVLIFVVLVNGLGVFWPHTLSSAQLKDGKFVLGEILQREEVPDTDAFRKKFRVGNRDFYADFRWIDETDIESIRIREDAVALERMEYGNFYGFVDSVSIPGKEPIKGPGAWTSLLEVREQIKPLRKEIKMLAARINKNNIATEKLHAKELKLKYRGVEETDERLEPLLEKMAALKADFEELVMAQSAKQQELNEYKVIMADANGRTKEIEVAGVVRAYQPNSMSTGSKIWFYLGKVKELLTDEPRESNTEGGLFPAIFGTVVLVFIMSIFSFPFGVMAGIYLREYAREGWLLKSVRIAVNNLAGVPSIVYGVFGLGFFVYGLGAGIDHVLFPEHLPEPTFGTGGLLWASLTLGLLTLPVVIVATEEAFGAIPRGVREASLALGATKLQTLLRVLIPMASPGIMTGFILAMARAAGEVAPLMITGVVKMAPALPIDGQAPFVHLNRKFMHLGFHIYDMGFQSPNVEAAKPMVFVTTLLLVLIVLLLTSTAISLRNKMKKRFTLGAF